MRRKIKIIWIDDNPEREESSVSMRHRLKANVEFGDVKNNDLHDYLEKLLTKKQPDLILIDHKFEDTDSGFFKTGSTISAYIRETWPSCPIICVTGVEKEDVEFQKKSQYEDIFEYHNISKFDAEILSIAKGFNTVNESSPNSVEAILNLLKAPELDRKKLTAILPSEIKDYFGDSGLSKNISHWVRNTLIARPGFLYDRMWVCTLLGLNELGFAKVENLFKSAKYSGIFAIDSDPKWWKSQVLTILNEKIQKGKLSQEKGRNLKSIKIEHHSHCYVNPKDIPETVAFEDETPSSKRYPMSLKNTIPHPSFSELLFFEEIRLMKPLE